MTIEATPNVNVWLGMWGLGMPVPTHQLLTVDVRHGVPVAQRPATKLIARRVPGDLKALHRDEVHGMVRPELGGQGVVGSNPASPTNEHP
jgi:hypothetical protein